MDVASNGPELLCRTSSQMGLSPGFWRKKDQLVPDGCTSVGLEPEKKDHAAMTNETRSVFRESQRKSSSSLLALILCYFITVGYLSQVNGRIN